jgi:hypothetical protein
MEPSRSTLNEPAASPAPVRAPIRAWVVEMGRPSRVATSTVTAAPAPTATGKAPSTSRLVSTRPLPEKALTSSPASSRAASEPTQVAAVAVARATR